MADIISFRDDPHHDAERLLPWYATGQLDAQDAAALEAHLAGCAPCRALLERERRLQGAVASLPLQPDLGWEKLQRRLAPAPRDRMPVPLFTPRWPQALAAFAAAQALLLAGAVMIFRPAPPQADFRTLGAPSTSATPGNLLIMFRPDISEEELRFTLDRAGARLVDGPTAAGAYVLRVDPARRDAALADLRTRRGVTLAQPIDSDPPR